MNVALNPLLFENLANIRLLIIFGNRGVGASTDTKANTIAIPEMANDAENPNDPKASVMHNLSRVFPPDAGVAAAKSTKMRIEAAVKRMGPDEFAVSSQMVER